VSKSNQRPGTGFDQINSRQSSEAGPSGSGHVAASRGSLLGSARTFGLWPKGDSQEEGKSYDVEKGGRNSDLKKSRTFPAADEGTSGHIPPLAFMIPLSSHILTHSLLNVASDPRRLVLSRSAYTRFQFCVLGFFSSFYNMTISLKALFVRSEP
jgi:hypothetical protein